MKIMWGIFVGVFLALAGGVVGQSNTNCIQNGYTYANVDNCRKYYRCNAVGGPTTQYSCPMFLYWNCFTSTCQRVKIKDCCPNDTTATIFGIGLPCLINGMKTPNLMNCSVYYQCVNFKIVKKTCPSGYRFDILSMSCKVAKFGLCATGSGTTSTSTSTSTSRSTSTSKATPTITTSTSTSTSTTTPTTPTSTSTSTSTSTTTPTTTTSITTSTTTTTPTPSTSTSTTSTTTTTPTPSTSTSTTTTTTPTPSTSTSTSTTTTTPTISTSTSTTTTTTTPTPTPTKTPTSTSTTTAPPTTATKGWCLNNSTISDVFNCNLYFQCYQNSIKKFSCPSSTPYYNCWKRTCTANKRPFCCTPNLNPVGQNKSCPTNGVKTAVPLSCVAYYECVSGTITKKFCKLGQAFDIWSKTCKNPVTARCGLKPGLTVCKAGMSGALPFGSLNFNINLLCPKW